MNHNAFEKRPYKKVSYICLIHFVNTSEMFDKGL